MMSRDLIGLLGRGVALACAVAFLLALAKREPVGLLLVLLLLAVLFGDRSGHGDG